MEFIERTAAYQRHAFGSPWDKNICKLSFGYTHTFKKVAAASTTAVHAAITANNGSAKTVVDSITNPDVPRVLQIVAGGTAAHIADGSVIVTGTNVEGKTLVETFDVVADTAGATVGTMAFKTVTSVVISAMKGAAATVSVGYTNALGLRHRLLNQGTTVKVVSALTIDGTRTTQAAPTITDADEQYVEKNLITPAVNPDGTTFLTVYYLYDAWSIGDINDDPKYNTSTSTSSTSTSTSTTATPSTSTSSTSVSTSSTTVSTSSTSTSQTTTSTSTTTVP